MATNRTKAPRFDDFRSSSAAASRIKRRNPPLGTKAELLLRRTLWAKGLRYRLQAGDLPGKPDIVFRRQRLAVFVDGDFWHGRDWPMRRGKLERGSNAAYWLAKIGYNIERDRKTSSLLESMGWRVMRCWETDVLRAPETVASDILKQLSGWDIDGAVG